MKLFRPACGLLLVVLASVGAVARPAAGREGFEWGPFRILPDAGLLEAYDNRTVLNPAGGDFYTELEAGVRLENLPARYRFAATARGGYRFYSQYDDFNDDFYSLGASLGSGEGSLKWGVSTDLTKALGYNTDYNPATGQGPDSILTDESNRRSVTQANLGYEQEMGEKTTLTPGYALTHYYQEIPGRDTAEWQIHAARLLLRRAATDKTRLTAEAGYSLQVNDDEEGSVGTFLVGIESRATDKATWSARVGYSLADYERSGKGQGFVGDVRGSWQVTEKVSTYLFGGSDYQPGYGGGGARQVHRVGYGAGWQATDRLAFQASGLHDYQDEVGAGGSGGGAYGSVRHFFEVQVSRELFDRLLLGAGAQYNKDEKDPAQTILFLSLKYAI